MAAPGNGSGPATPYWAVAAVAAGALATAFNPVFVRLSDLDPVGSAVHRIAWALPLMWLWVGLERGTASAPATRQPGDRLLLALCGLFFAADLIALHWSIQLTSVANAILFLNAQPIYVVLGAWLLFGERVTPHFLAGVATAMIGAAVMLGESLQFGGARPLGDTLGLVAGLCYAGYILTANRLRRRVSSATINAWTCLIAGPVLLAVALGTRQAIVPGSLEGWALMVGLGVVSQACGQGLIVTGMAQLTAGFAAVVLLLAPVASALYGWTLLDEAMTLQQIAGMLVVLAGLSIAHRASLATPARSASVA
jgi:drug/metabolite transporter (DMT)-like permease